MSGKCSGGPLVFFLVCGATHLFGLPALIQLFFRRWGIEAAVATMALTCSFMYHLAEAWDRPFFLAESEWHRMDNVYSLSCFWLLAVYIACIKNVFVAQCFKLFFMGIILILQQAAPFDLRFTFAPLLVSAALPFITHGLVYRQCPPFVMKNVLLGFGIFLVAGAFYLRGLDDATDPCRVFHGLWHAFVGIASVFLWRVVKTKEAMTLFSPIQVENGCADEETPP